MTITSAVPEVTRDRYGRPLIVPRNGTKPTPYTRATTFVGAFEDQHNLTQWKIRQAAIGLSLRKDLLLAVAAHRDDKNKLNAICGEALEAASASAAATTGTALHALSEQVDRGQKVEGLSDDTLADLAAYTEATADLIPVYIEQLMVFDRWHVAGTPDRVVEFRGKRYIADLKTGDIEWGAGKIAAQLAMYARSEVYDVRRPNERVIHEAEVDKGLVIHLPAGSGTCRVVWIDLLAGWEIAKTCADVREKRKLKAQDLYAPLDEVFTLPPQARIDLGAAIVECTDAEAVRALWAQHEAEWNDELTKLAAHHIHTMEVAS